MQFNFKYLNQEVTILIFPKIWEVITVLEELDCPVIQAAVSNIQSGYNTGFTYSKGNTSVMVINKCTSIVEVINTYNHEKNHIEMHICKELGIDPYSEEASYLSGDLSELIFDKILQQIWNLF